MFYGETKRFRKRLPDFKPADQLYLLFQKLRENPGLERSQDPFQNQSAHLLPTLLRIRTRPPVAHLLTRVSAQRQLPVAFIATREQLVTCLLPPPLSCCQRTALDGQRNTCLAVALPADDTRAGGAGTRVAFQGAGMSAGGGPGFGAFSDAPLARLGRWASDYFWSSIWDNSLLVICMSSLGSNGPRRTVRCFRARFCLVGYQGSDVNLFVSFRVLPIEL
jgi:hypothetical protein